MKIRELPAISNICEVAIKENAMQRSILLAKKQTMQRAKLGTKETSQNLQDLKARLVTPISL